MIDTIKGFAADIDMTLTSKGAMLPEKTMEAFEAMHKAGIPLGLATGRVLENNLKTQGRDWNLSFEFDYLVCMNGGQVYDGKTGKLWETKRLTCEEEKYILSKLIDIIDQYKISVNMEGGNDHAMHIGGELEDAMKRHGWRFTDKTYDLDGFCTKEGFKFLFRTKPEYAEILRKRFDETLAGEYQIVSTYPGTLEILRQGIDKGSGVAVYASWYDLDIKDFIAFGDNENDNKMLERCGWGVCLKGGNPATAAISDDVTDYGCFEGGVGYYLIDHYLKDKGLI